MEGTFVLASGLLLKPCPNLWFSGKERELKEVTAALQVFVTSELPFFWQPITHQVPSWTQLLGHFVASSLSHLEGKNFPRGQVVHTRLRGFENKFCLFVCFVVIIY